jgi:O-antigen/teichoic acid export membrane protein
VLGLALQFVVSALISPVLAHMLPPAEFGALATGITLHQIMVVLAIIGMDQALVLQRMEDRNSRAARGLITVSIFIAVVMTFLFAMTAPAWGTALGLAEYSGLVNVIILWTVPAVAVQAMNAFLLSEDRIWHFFTVCVIATVGGQLLGLILLLTVNKDAMTFSLGALGSQFAAMGLAIVLAGPRTRGFLNWPITKRAIKLGLPLTAASIALFQLNAGDRLVIQVILGPEEVGRYQAAYVMGSIALLLLSFTSGAWTPVFAAMSDHSVRWAAATHSRDALYRLLLPATAGMTLAAPLGLQVLLPASFRPEELTIVVFLVCLAAFPVASGCTTGRLLLILRRGKTMGLLTTIAAVASLLLNFALVPQWGIVGAAAATVLTYTLLAALQRRALPTEPVWRKVPPRLAVAMVTVTAACAISIFLPQTLEYNLARAAIALACLPWLIAEFKRARAFMREVNL